MGNVQESITNVYHPGMYQAGFFPIMMFGLPGAALAIAKKADEKNKKATKAIMLAGALASFATGVTEPLEFSFMFAAPQLYLIHAAFTGISAFLAASLKAYAGFGFSAGLVDFVLSIKNPMHANILILVVMGLVYFCLYYFVFSTLIEKLDIATPGRNTKDMGKVGATDKSQSEEEREEKLTISNSYEETARKILASLGGAENIDTTGYCTTRLRLTVKDPEKVNDDMIKSAGVAGVMKPGPKAVQVIIGPQVQAVYDEFVKLV